VKKVNLVQGGCLALQDQLEEEEEQDLGALLDPLDLLVNLGYPE
jgi:hypothetical protein